MAHSEDERQDAARDAIALYRAFLRGDKEGTHAIVGNTRCAVCLVNQAVTIGLVLGVHDPVSFSRDSDGYTVIASPDREHIEAVLNRLLNGPYRPR